jgi:hypothetical protein
MAADFYWKQHDTAPAIISQLTDSASVPVDLTGATVKFHMKAQGAGTLKINAAATVADASSGYVEYQPVTADTDTAGDYQAEWEVVYSSGNKQTFPDPGYLTVTITADLDNA